MKSKNPVIWSIILILTMSLSVYKCSAPGGNTKVIINIAPASTHASLNQSLFDRLLQFLATEANAQVPPSVTSILLRVTGSGMDKIENTYPSSTTTVTLEVPSGPGRIFTVEGRNSVNEVLYVGSSQSMSLTGGETVNLSITMHLPGRIYVANWGSNTVSVIDSSTNTVVRSISVGQRPSGIVVNPTSRKGYVANMLDATVSVIDLSTHTVSTTITSILSSNSFFEPFPIGINTSTNKIYIGDFYAGNDDIAVINGSTDIKFTDIITTSWDNYPSGIGVNPVTNKIYVPLWGEVLVVNGATDTGNGLVTIGAFAWNNPFGVGVNSNTNRIYIANNSDTTVNVINGSTDTVINSITVGNSPYGVGVNVITNKIYVANNNGNNVSVINGATDTVITTVNVGTNPLGVAVNSNTNRIYISNSGSNSVSVIDGSTDTVIQTILVGTSPAYLDVLQ